MSPNVNYFSVDTFLNLTNINTVMFIYNIKHTKKQEMGCAQHNNNYYKINIFYLFIGLLFWANVIM